MSKFADYGFNKCHAAPYGLVAYQTAWMKANHPEAFVAACMSLAVNNTDRLAALRQEAARRHQPLRRRLHPGTPRRWPPRHPLRAGRSEEGRGVRHAGDGRCARRP
jgi:hypothetical protein